jgi:hypothetical protein
MGAVRVSDISTPLRAMFSGTRVDSAPDGNWGDAVDFDFPPRQNLPTPSQVFALRLLPEFLGLTRRDKDPEPTAFPYLATQKNSGNREIQQLEKRVLGSGFGEF